MSYFYIPTSQRNVVIEALHEEDLDFENWNVSASCQMALGREELTTLRGALTQLRKGVSRADRAKIMRCRKF